MCVCVQCSCVHTCVKVYHASFTICQTHARMQYLWPINYPHSIKYLMYIYIFTCIHTSHVYMIEQTLFCFWNVKTNPISLHQFCVSPPTNFACKLRTHTSLTARVMEDRTMMAKSKRNWCRRPHNAIFSTFHSCVKFAQPPTPIFLMENKNAKPGIIIVTIITRIKRTPKFRLLSRESTTHKTPTPYCDDVHHLLTRLVANGNIMCTHNVPLSPLASSYCHTRYIYTSLMSFHIVIVCCRAVQGVAISIHIYI